MPEIIPRVTYVIQSFGATGPMRPPYMVCKGFAEAGWDVDILTLGTLENENMTVAWNIVPVRRVLAKKRKVGLLKIAWRLIKPRRDHIIINTVWDFHCFALMLSKIIFGSPYVIRLDTYTHRHHFHGTSLTSILWHEFRYGLILRMANYLLAETPTVVKYTEQYVPGAQVLQIPPSLWLKDLRKLEKRWGLEGYQPRRDSTIIYAGRIVKRKNIHDLITAFSRLAANFPEWNLEIRGPISSDEYYVQLQELVRKHSLAGRVNFEPGLFGDELYQRYRATSIYCMPSTGEGLPGTILEAMYFGGAIVAGTSGYVGYQLDFGRCGLLHEPGDVETLTDHLARLMASIEDRQIFMENARQRMIKLFTWEVHFETLANALRSDAIMIHELTNK